MLNILVWLCTDEFLAKEWPFVCHGSSAKQHRLNWLFQRWEVNVVTIYKCKVPLHWPNTLRQCCASVVTYSYKRWDNIITCYRIHIMCLAQHCPNMLDQRRATSHLYIVTTLSSQHWPWTIKMSRCWPNVSMRLYLIVLNVCLSW